MVLIWKKLGGKSLKGEIGKDRVVFGLAFAQSS